MLGGYLEPNLVTVGVLLETESLPESGGTLEY